MKLFWSILIILVSFAFYFPSFASTSDGTVSTTDKYAWGDVMGWINFSPSNGGVHINDSSITGYAWSNSAGWLNFNPSGSGESVTNTCDGVLGGSAWSSTLGWINMKGATINSSGIFTGIVGSSASTTGKVNFDCDHCKVTTDWRHCSDRSNTTPSGGGGGGAGGGGGGISNTRQAAAALTGTNEAVSSQGGACIDIVPDGRVDILDFNSLVVNWGSTSSNNIADTNKDGVVDILDFNSVMVCWTRT